MSANFADRLIDAIEQRSAPAVIALDPVYDRMPKAVRDAFPAESDGQSEHELEAIFEFSLSVLKIIASHVPAVKINSAYFERYFADGVQSYFDLVAEAADLGLLVIGDVKRGDVGHTAEQYARGHLADCPFDDIPVARVPDAITVNGYFGLDGVKPFADVCAETGRGLFVLVRTSNPSAAAIQDLVTVEGVKVHERLAAQVAEWSAAPNLVGRHGFSSIGAVVATRNAADAARLREAMPHNCFLVPGYGAQGGTAEDVKPYFNREGRGAIIAAGRSVIFAHAEPRHCERFGDDWEACVDAACRELVSDLRRIISA